MRSFTESGVSDSDNTAPFENTTPINLSTCSAFFYFELSRMSGIFKQYNVTFTRIINNSDRTALCRYVLRSIIKLSSDYLRYGSFQ